MKPPFPSFTPTWHNDTYPAINPTQPSLSQSGKTVIVTGGGSGIGRETALAFATAGAAHIVLLGRTESTLRGTQDQISSSSSAKVSVFPVDVADESGIRKVAEEVGTWDVLVLNAGYTSAPGPVAKSSVETYWKHYETNVKSIIIASATFFPRAAPKNAAVFVISAGGIALTVEQTAGLSGYFTSKVAQTKLAEYLAAENPHLFICSVQPGIVETTMLETSGFKEHAGSLPMDTVQLPAHFLVWLAQSQKNRFLNGRFIWVNWDVDELAAKAEEIEKSTVLTVGYTGWPFASEGT